jgi:hypothetical protein
MDTTKQMIGLVEQAKQMAENNGHTMTEFKEFAGGAVKLAICNICKRFAKAEIWPSGHDVSGSAIAPGLHCQK